MENYKAGRLLFTSFEFAASYPKEANDSFTFYVGKMRKLIRIFDWSLWKDHIWLESQTTEDGWDYQIYISEEFVGYAKKECPLTDNQIEFFRDWLNCSLPDEEPDLYFDDDGEKIYAIWDHSIGKFTKELSANDSMLLDVYRGYALFLP